MKKKKLIMCIVLFFGMIYSRATTVYVSKSFGFNVTDATPFLQKAFDSGADTVIVDFVGKDWIVTPLFVKSNTVIIFEPGVVVLAKKGEFHGDHDCLITVANASNISLIGYGAILRMRKSDYQGSSYTKSEFRHTLNIQALVDQPVENIIVKGFHFELSGGDGILVAGISGYPDHDPVQPKNILIQDVVCDKNHRDAISVTGGENVKIVNAVLKETGGTPPQAGIDWEPDWERLINVGMSNCLMYNNQVTGLTMYLYRPAWRGPSDISLTFNNCHIDSDNGKQGIALNISNIEDDGAGGNVIFNDCSFRNRTTYSTLSISDKSALKARLTFNRCFMEQTNSTGKVIELSNSNANTKDNMTFGGIDFNDCIINDRYNRNFLTFADNVNTGKGIRDIKGNIVVNNPNGAKTSIGAISQDINLQITENKSMPPQVNITSPLLLIKKEVGDSTSMALKATAYDTDAGTSDGSGIQKVIFVVMHSDSILYSSEDAAAPFESNINTSDWEPGLYQVKAVAVSSEFGSKNISVSMFEIVPKPIVPTTVIDDTPPTVPTNLQASEIIENDFILSWDQATDDSGIRDYEVFKDGVSCGKTEGLSMKINGLFCNRQYKMTVKAYDKMYNISTASTNLDVTTAVCSDQQAPSVPTGVVVSELGYSSFVLSWNASTDNKVVTGYMVYKNNVLFQSTSDTSIKFDNLTLGSAYTITITAEDASQNVSEPSSPVVVTTKSCSLPTGWTASVIGSGNNLACESDRVFTMKSTGTDIWGTADQFIFTNKILFGDGVILAKIKIVDNFSQWAKVGLMIREGTSSGSKYMACLMTLSAGISLQNRTTTGGSTVNEMIPGIVSPYWLKLERTGNTFTAYTSLDGNDWQLYGNSFMVDMKPQALIGLAVINCNAEISDVNVISSPDLEPPTVPDGITTTAINPSGITLKWNASTDNYNVAGYEVFQNDVSIGTSKTPTKVVSNLVCNTLYHFTIRAYDDGVNFSELSKSFDIQTSVCTGIDNFEEAENQIIINPNPAISNLTLSNIPPDSKVTVLTIDGGIVKQFDNAGKTTFNVNVEKWAKGIYLFKIVSVHTDKREIVRKVIVQ